MPATHNLLSLKRRTCFSIPRLIFDNGSLMMFMVPRWYQFRARFVIWQYRCKYWGAKCSVCGWEVPCPLSHSQAGLGGVGAWAIPYRKS